MKRQKSKGKGKFKNEEKNLQLTSQKGKTQHKRNLLLDKREQKPNFLNGQWYEQIVPEEETQTPLKHIKSYLTLDIIKTEDSNYTEIQFFRLQRPN